MKENYIEGSGNVFKDLGFANLEEELVKAKLASVINDIIEEQGLAQKHAGEILGINQPEISALKNGRLKGFSIKRLFSFLEALEQHVGITQQRKDFKTLLESLGQASFEEIEQVLQERESVAPEAGLTPEIMQRLQAKIMNQRAAN